MESVCCPENNVPNDRNQNKVEYNLTYSAYLNLDKLLSIQNLRSLQFNKPAHHEHLFIIIHQVYELWFKQIIFELDSINCLLKKGQCNDHFEIIKRLHRIVLILKLMIDQFDILETMSSFDFLEFRQFLCSASGAESLQFRIIENKLGLFKRRSKSSYEKDCMLQIYSEEAFQLLKESEVNSDLFCIVQQWLETVPWRYINYECFLNFYELGIQKFLSGQESTSKASKNINKIREFYESLIDEDKHKLIIEQEEGKFSRLALLGAIAIFIYHEELNFNTMYQILNLIVDIDVCLFKWRYNHMLMVSKIIGIRTSGTGGSSGCSYLQSTLSDEYRIFYDLTNISNLLIPREFIPTFSRVKINENCGC